MSFAQVRRLVSLALLGIFASPLLAQPAITGLQPADGSLLSARTGTLSGQAVDATLLRVDGVELTLGAGGSFSYAFDLPEGESALSIYAEDAGGATSQVHHLEVDTLAPGIVVSSPAQTRVGASPVFVAGTVQEPHLQSVTVRGSPATLNGNSFSSSITLNEGAQNIAIVATDTLGHSSTSTLVLTLDTQAPAISVNESGAPFTGGLFDRPLTPQITITDAGTYTSEILLDGSPYVSGTPIGQEGSHQLAISATDAVGNTSSRDISFTLDFTAPVFGQITPAAGALIAQSTVTLQVEATGATSVMAGSLTGSAAGNLYTIGPIALVEGSQELVVEAFDAVGNRAERRHALVRDTTAPTLSIVSPAEGAVLTSSPAVVSGQALDPRLASVRVGGELASLSGSTFSISKALVEGGNSFLVEALDSAGNSATQTLNLTLDTTAPSFVVKVNGVILAGGEVYSAAITPTLELSEPSATVTATLDGSSFTFGSAISVDGNHQLSVTVTHNNLSSSNLFSFRIDRQAPSFPSLEPAEGTVLAATSVLLEGRVQGATSLTIDGVPVALQGEVFTAGPYTLSAGSRTFELIATSAGGLQTTLSRTVVQDSVPPQLVVQQPAEGALLGSANTAVSGTATDPHLLRVRVSGVDAQVSASSFYASGVSLAEGSNTLTVVAEDRAGNQQQATRTVVRDTLDPEVAITDPVAGTVVPAASYVVRGSASDAHLDRVEVNGRRATLAAGDFSLSVSLAEGSNSIEAVAFDRLGHSKTTTVTISRDSAAPQITIQDPPEGFATQAATLTVRGAYEDEPGTTVKVNGLVAVLTSGHFEVAGIELLPGENRITARATDAQGNEGVHTRTVVRDQVAPTFVRLEPAAGALALPLATVFTLTFSEEMAPPAEGAISLATAGGTQLVFTAVVQGKDVVLTPQALLPPETTLVLTLTAGLVDLAGNALSPLPAPFELTTVDTGAPGAPVLGATPLAAACRHDVELAGTAEPLSQVRVQGGAAAALTRADEAGAFTLLVELLPEQLNVLHVVAIDALGNISPELLLELAADCTPPQVLGATLVGDTVSVTFSEAVNAPASAFALISPSGPETFGFAASGATATLTLSAAPSGLLELAVGEGATTGISDLAGNAMSYPWHHLFGAGAGDSFLAGTVFDDGKGQPLRGVLVSVTATNGVSLGDPLPQQTTTDDGRFLLGLPVGTHDVTFARPGYAPVFRVVTTASGEGTHVFDPRLTLLNLPQAIGSVGGEVVAGAARLAVPAGALASSQATSLTELSEQALPALLPYGYSPRGAVYVSIDASFAAPATLTLPIDTLMGREVVIASLDFALLQWKTIEVRTVSGQTLDIAISAPGAYVAVEADSESAALLVPVLGQVLPSLPAPAGDEVTAADIDFAPTLVLPSQRSLATVSYTLANAGTPAPSGMPLTLSVQERLTLLDGSERRAVPYSADLLVFRSPSGNARSRFWLQPSPLAASLPIEIGAEDVSVRTFGATTVRGNILGPDGGSVLGVSGDVFEVPAGALNQPTAVVVTRRTVADLSHPAPAGFPVLGVIEVDLGGAQLAGIGSLTLATETPPTAGSRGILLGTVEVDGEPRWRALVELEPVAAGWRTVTSGGSNPHWPGIRQGGLYLALELEGDWGLLEGALYDSDQNLVAGGLISSVAVPWIQLSGSNGSYVIPLPAGAAVVVSARDLRYDQVAVEIPALTDGERRVFDLEVLPTGPTVIEIEPADGAANVPTTFLPRVKFSEPVDRSTLAAGIHLTRDGEPVAIELDHQGDEVIIDPVASLIPDTTYQLEVGTEVSDLQGRLLSSPRSVSFRTTALPAPAPGIDASKLRLYEPDYQGLAQIIGLPGAVPADSTLWIENVATTTIVSAADGSFLLEVPAAVSDTLFLTVLIPGQSAATQVLGPWLLRGDLGAWIGASGGSFKTALGVDVTVERGTFNNLTRVALAAKPAPIATTSRLAVLLDFELDLGGAVAQKSILLRMPAPSGSQASSTYLLNRYTEALGRRGWMAMDLLRLDGANLTNATFGAVTSSVVARSLGVGTMRFENPAARVLSAEDMEGLRDDRYLPRAAAALPEEGGNSFSALPRSVVTSAAIPSVGQGIGLPGLRGGGRYQVAVAGDPMSWLSIPAVGQMAAFSYPSSGPPFVAMSLDELLHSSPPTLNLPRFRDEEALLEVLDLGTGYQVYEGILPPTNEPLVVLPPDLVSDHTPPIVEGGSPLRFTLIPGFAQGEFEVDEGIVATITEDSIEIAGASDSAFPGAQVKLFGINVNRESEARVEVDGSFHFAVTSGEDDIFLLAIGGQIGPSESLALQFTEQVVDLQGVEIYSAENGFPAPEPSALRKVPLEQGIVWEIVPATGWRAGTQLLRITPDLADGAGNSWPREFELEFEVAQASSISSIPIPRFADFDLLGNVLAIAGNDGGLSFFDVSNPAEPAPFLAQNQPYHFAGGGAIRGVRFDAHGRAVVVGSGEQFGGQLHVLDVMTMDRESTEIPSVYADAVWGFTSISSPQGQANPALPASGLVRRVAVLNADDETYLVPGESEPPEDLTITTLPWEEEGDLLVRITGSTESPHSVVSLHNLSMGRWERTESESDGSFVFEVVAQEGSEFLLSRSLGAWAFATIDGFGLAAVDLNDIRGGVATEFEAFAKVRYTRGYDLNRAPVCDPTRPQIDSTPVDLEALVPSQTAAGLQPGSLVTLVQGYGLAIYSLDPNDPRHLSELSSACAAVDSQATVAGMDVITGYGFDFDGDGEILSESTVSPEGGVIPAEVRDYAVVAHSKGWILVFDITSRAEPTLVGRIKIGKKDQALQISGVTIDPISRQIYVGAFGSGIFIVDFDAPPSLDFIDSNEDLFDDRVTDNIRVGSEEFVDVLAIPDLGIVWAGGRKNGVSSIAIEGPQVQIFSDDGEGNLTELNEVVPYGVPTASGDERQGVFQVRAAIASSAPEITIDVNGTGPGGKTVDEAGEEEGIPTPSVQTTLRRAANNPWEKGSTTYISERVAAIADLRASASYDMSAEEKRICVRCSQVDAGVYSGVPEPSARLKEVLSGSRISIDFSSEQKLLLGNVYSDHLNKATEVKSVGWAPSPSVLQEPPQNVAMAEMPGVLLHSGEFVTQDVDLETSGRAMDLAFQRSYRSQTLGAGPLGPGWDHNFNVHLRELPTGDVEVFDGAGRRDVFRAMGDGSFESPSGRFEMLTKSSQGFMLVDPQKVQAQFDFHGRLQAVRDSLGTAPGKGNEVKLTYDANSRLKAVQDPQNRTISFDYDDKGRLQELRDHTGRAWDYNYDPKGQLVSVKAPATDIGGASPRIEKGYSYSPPAGGDLRTRLNQLGQMKAVKKPDGRTWLNVNFVDSDGDGLPEEVQSQDLGPGSLSVQIDKATGQALVTDRRGFVSKFNFNAAGQPTRFEDTTGAIWQYQYNSDGLVTRMVEPLGRVTEYVYATGSDPRVRANLLETRVTADPRGENGSPQTLVSQFSYDNESNQPIRIVDPRGNVMAIDRSPAGLPLRIVRGEGTLEETVETFTYNEFGQVLEHVDGNGTKTVNTYYSDGPQAGFLRSTLVDPHGAALVTQYDVDSLGRVRAVTDGRGVRSEIDYNELGWKTETRQAVTGTNDGSAPPLSYRTRWQYDENGNVLNVEVPYGDGSQYTLRVFEYGLLDELKTIRSQIAPSGPGGNWVEEPENWITQSREYDANLNLAATVDGEGHRQEIVYEERNLPQTVTRGLGIGSLESPPVESFAYDSERQLRVWTDGRGKLWEQLYDGFGRPAEQRDPLGNYSKTEYDANSNPTAQRMFDSDGNLMARGGAAYDSLDRRKATQQYLWDPEVVPLPEPREVTTHFTYDRAGNVRSITDALGRSAERLYDTAGRLYEAHDPLGNRQVFSFDAASNVSSITQHDVTQNGIVASTTIFGFDALGREVVATDALGNQVRSGYDARSQIVQQIDQEDQVTTFQYDGIGRQIREIRPEGIEITRGFDRANRLVVYRDAKDSVTTYGFDAADRQTGITYPDGFSEAFEYDTGGNLVERLDALGNRIANTYDDANRLISRSAEVNVAAEVQGPFTESYGWDGLGRLVLGQSGNVVTERRYDSLSRLVSDSTNGRVFRYELNDVGEPVATIYPSGFRVERNFDALSRPTQIRGESATAALLQYHGPSAVEKVIYGNGLVLESTFDELTRPLSTTVGSVGLPAIFSEQTVWTPRSLRGGVARGDQNGLGKVFEYDGARRLVGAARRPEVLSGLINNSVPASQLISNAPEAENFEYDAALNLLSRTSRKDEGTTTVETPPDNSGRNRPASVGGRTLDWDANGNLKQKDQLRFFYDWRNRLRKVTNLGTGQVVATYNYDIFNRRVGKEIGNSSYGYSWDGWQQVEDSFNGPLQVANRRIYGLGLDGAVRFDFDLDGTGGPDAEYVPIYDSSGNLVALTDSTGKPVERYEYSAYGAQRIFVDSVPPEILQVRKVGNTIFLEISEEVSLAGLEAAIAAGNIGLEDSIHQRFPLTVSQPVQEGPLARRRIALTSTAEIAGTAPMRLVIGASILADNFLNRSPATAKTYDFIWSQDVLLEDTQPPTIERIALRGNRIEINFNEIVDPAQAAAAITVDGAALTWTRDASGYQLIADTPLSEGSHTVSLGNGPIDLAGKGLDSVVSQALTAGSEVYVVVFQVADPREVLASTVNNFYGFQGLPKDPETGFLYVRNRYYDTELGTFVTADPLGYVDGPSQYAFASSNPFNNSDPMGLLTLEEGFTFAGSFVKAAAIGAAVVVGTAVVATVAAPVAAALTVAAIGVAVVSTVNSTYQRHKEDPSAGWVQAASIGVSDTLGITAAFEGAAGFELGSGRRLSGVERADRLGTAAGTLAGGKLGKFASPAAVRVTEQAMASRAARRAGQGGRVASSRQAQPQVCGGCPRVCRCFVVGTLIAAANGQKPIEEIEIGDEVWAQNPDTGSPELAKVVNLYRRDAPGKVVIHVGDEKIEVTSEHPFFVTDRGWVAAGELRVGDQLVELSGETARVDVIETEPGLVGVFNFEVEGLHTYFVGPMDVLVHNCEGDVGRFEDLPGSRGDNLTPHHVPSANHMAQHGVDRGKAWAIDMEAPFPGSGGRHRQTFTYGTRADANMTPRQALAAGVQDLRKIYRNAGMYQQIRSKLQELVKNNKTDPGFGKLFAKPPKE